MGNNSGTTSIAYGTIKNLTIEKKDEAIWIQFQTGDSALLIGYHGETLSSLQLMISLIVSQALGSWQKIVVNVNNWREERDEQLKVLAANFAQRVKFSGKPQILPPLSSSERRVIHLYLSDYSDVESVSQGVGRDRRLLIKPKIQ